MFYLLLFIIRKESCLLYVYFCLIWHAMPVISFKRCFICRFCSTAMGHFQWIDILYRMLWRADMSVKHLVWLIQLLFVILIYCGQSNWGWSLEVDHVRDQIKMSVGCEFINQYQKNISIVLYCYCAGGRQYYHVKSSVLPGEITRSCGCGVKTLSKG